MQSNLSTLGSRSFQGRGCYRTAAYDLEERRKFITILRKKKEKEEKRERRKRRANFSSEV